jgi:hypothetical protein
VRIVAGAARNNRADMILSADQQHPTLGELSTCTLPNQRRVVE